MPNPAPAEDGIGHDGEYAQPRETAREAANQCGATVDQSRKRSKSPPMLPRVFRNADALSGRSQPRLQAYDVGVPCGESRCGVNTRPHTHQLWRAHVPCCVSCEGIPEGTDGPAGRDEVRREETEVLRREGMSRSAAFYTLHAVADKDHSNSAAASQRIGQARTCCPAIPGQSQIRPNQA